MAQYDDQIPPDTDFGKEYEKDRRRSYDRYVEELRSEHEKLRDCVNILNVNISSFMAQVKIVGVIALAIWAGSFVYTTLVKKDFDKSITECREASETRITNAVNTQDHYIDLLKTQQAIAMDKFHTVVEDHEDKIISNEHRIVVAEERFIRLLEKIDITNKRLDEIIIHVKE